jgi:hypothetical protein
VNAVSADDDTAGLTEEAAIEWLRREYGLSLGAATLELQNAWNSGKVRGWDNLVEIRDGKTVVLRDGKPVHIPPRLSQITGDFVHDHRLSADDLRWQIEQQLGKLAVAKPPNRSSEPPSQAELDKALLDFATARGQKVKQADTEARAMLAGLGAKTRQITTAFRKLPGQYRYPRGKPGKSGA